MSCLLEPLLDSTRVARVLGVEVETLGAWRRRGYGPRWYRIGKKIKYAEADIRAWMNAQVNGGLSTSQPEGGKDAA
jgi:predicted site-specific integrase-resolvase